MRTFVVVVDIDVEEDDLTLRLALRNRFIRILWFVSSTIGGEVVLVPNDENATAGERRCVTSSSSSSRKRTMESRGGRIGIRADRPCCRL
mmetsp:Transcript_26510/g.62264  ORF Transcript_26510/g.62264 Transcript_26510/m.62264 type:complete len:90 (+) Transcript_26510:1334-1603(+)